MLLPASVLRRVFSISGGIVSRSRTAELLRRLQEQRQGKLDAGVVEVAAAFGEAQSCAAADGSSSQSVRIGNEGCWRGGGDFGSSVGFDESVLVTVRVASDYRAVVVTLESVRSSLGHLPSAASYGRCHRV